SDAVLPEELIAWLSHEEKKTELCQSFFKQISSTRIDPKTGNAIDKSLRNIEVTIPLNLTATLTVLNEDALNALNWEENQTWIDGLTSCFKLIRAVGASRSRGLGRVKVTGIIEIC
ncbi:MAG: hypothetical protein KAI17_26425, partial [Thiotrichaceae bacterium]|nr:hypothetical protein [Thiotrichaceae bacterium]